MIFDKKLKFFHLLCFFKKWIEKKFLLTFYIKRKPLNSIKTNVYEKRKIRIFPKGLVHRFDQKFEISQTFIFMQKGLRKSIWERSS